MAKSNQGRQSPPGLGCSAMAAARPPPDQLWPYHPGLAPAVVKTHYPQIGGAAVKQFTRLTTRHIHIVRNPFDNIASRYFGSHSLHQSRFDSLLGARALGPNSTTPEFSMFVQKEVAKYRGFYTYWLKRAAELNAVPFFFTWYESLCNHTAVVLHKMLHFSGFDVDRDRLACTVAEQPCIASSTPNNTVRWPSHAALFTAEQA